MADDFHEKLRAQRAHIAAVPGALDMARRLIEAAPADDTREALRTLVAEVERLQASVQQLQKDMREEQREFQREARDIAAEARWQERQERDEWGSF